MIDTQKLMVKDFFEEAGKTVEISDNRKVLLTKITDSIVAMLNDKKTVNINFICTHNSRRSQLGQVWGFFAVDYFKLSNINTFSGGTEVTAFHRNTVKTLKQVGFTFNVTDFSHQNPVYAIDFGTDKKLAGFSKQYHNSVNKTPFIAVTTCDSADANCPFIPEAIGRFHMPFVDPKISDGTERQDETYLVTNKQIAGELFFVFSEVAKQIA